MAHNSNSNPNYSEQHDRGENGIVNDEKVQSYLKDLLKERICLNNFPHSSRLVENGIFHFILSYVGNFSQAKVKFRHLALGIPTWLAKISIVHHCKIFNKIWQLKICFYSN